MAQSRRSGSSRALRQTQQKDIAHANEVSDADFILEYLKPGNESWSEWTHPRNGVKYTLSLVSSGTMSADDLESCFKLIEETSGEDYRGSSLGWHPAAKKEEMRSPELRYLLVRRGRGREGIQDPGQQAEHSGDGSARPESDTDEQQSQPIQGFASIMPTFENQEPVLYCYEVHLQPELQGTGLGRRLMGLILSMGRNLPSVDKVMLTCFVSNERASAFYGKLGFQVDESSPGDRKLRGGRVVTSDYVIMSRST